MRKEIEVNSKRAKKKTSVYGKETAEFLALGYTDYVASRVLVNSGLLLAGAMLASTAIEKYFKAVLAFRGNVSVGHLKKAHINAVTDFDPDVGKALNYEFLELLRRVYKLRYLDTLEIGFNIVIASREFLAELDFTTLLLQEGFSTSQAEVPNIQTYHAHKQQRDSRLLSNNHVLLGENKQQFISRIPQLIYEARRCPVRGFIDAEYRTPPCVSDGRFLRTGYAPLDDEGVRYQFAFKPLPSSHTVNANTIRLTGTDKL